MIARYFETEENSIYLGGLLFFLGVLLFVWFAGSLRAAVATVEGGVARIASIVFAAAVMMAVCGLGLFVPQISAAFAANESKAPLTPQAAQALWAAGDGFFVAAEYAGALLLVATAIAVWRWRILPVWLAWIQVILAVVMLIPPIGWAALIFAFPLWVILVSVLLYLRAPPAASVQAPPATPAPPA